MAIMTADWKPDPEAAGTFSRYREALTTERELKPDVQELALAGLKAGATITQLAKLTGMTPEVFRRMARKLDIPIDPRYAERAEKLRAKPAAVDEAPGPAVTEEQPDWLAGFPEIAALTRDQAKERAGRLLANRPEWFEETRRVYEGDAHWVDYAMLAADRDDPAPEPPAE